MYEWIEGLMEETGCDWETAVKEYNKAFWPEDYEPEEHEN